MLNFSAIKGLGVGAVALLGAALGPGPALAETINVGVQAAPPDEIYLARDWAEPYDIGIEYTEFSSGGDMLQAFLAGRIDVANGGSARIVTLAARQPDKFYIISTHQYGGDRYGLIVASNSAVETVADLKGKKLGAVTGSGAYNVFLLYLDQNGMSASDFQVVNMKAEDIASALQSGIIDGGIVWEPFPSIAEWSGVAKRVVSMKGVSESPVFLLVDRNVADNNPELVERYLAAAIDAGEFMKESTEEAGALAAKRISARGVDISSEALSLSFTRFEVGSPVTDDLLEELVPVAETMKEMGNIDAVPDFKSLVRPEFYEAAMIMRNNIE